MITLHHAKETDFAKNGYGSLDDHIINPEVSWEMNGEFKLEFDYPMFGKDDIVKHLKNRNIVRTPVPYMDDQQFRIYRTTEEIGFIRVEARHIFYDLLDNFIEDTNVVSKTGQGAVEQLLGATQYQHEFKGFSDISKTNNMRIVRYNPVQALLDDSEENTFINRWGGEILRDNLQIHMKKRLGSNKGVRIEHKKDLLGYEATIDESTVATRIMPIGFDGLRLPEKYIDSPRLDPGNPRIKLVTYREIKAAVGKYAEDEDAIPLDEAYAELRRLARLEYSQFHVDEPETTIKVDFVTLENTKEYKEFSHLQEIHQGDTVKVSVPEQGFEITARLVAFTSDPLRKNHYTSTTLGNHSAGITSRNPEVATLKRQVEQAHQTAVLSQQAANSKNTNFFGVEDPNTLNLDARLGDTYFQEDGDYFAIWEYVEVNGERYWKKGPNTYFGKEISEIVNRAQDEAAEALKQTEKTNEKADAIKEGLGIGSLVTDSQAIVEGVKSRLDGISREASKSITKALEQTDMLIRETESNSLSLIGSARDNATKALADAEKALTDLENLEIGGRNLLIGTSQDEKTVVQQLDYRLATALPLGELTFSIWLKADKDTTVAVYINDDLGQNRTHLKFDMNVPVTTEFKKYTFTETLTKFQTADLNGIFMRVYSPGTTLTAKEAMLEKGNVSTAWRNAFEDMQFEIERLENQITLKASQMDLNAVKQTVDRNTLDISLTAKELATKANQTTVDGINRTVNTHTTHLNQTAQELSAKADQSSVDSINSTLSAHDSRISVNAREISQRLTSVQVDNKLAGYATRAYSDNQIASTAKSTRQLITSVEDRLVAIDATDLLNFGRFQSLVASEYTADPRTQTIRVTGTPQHTSIRYNVQDGELIEGEWYTFTFDLTTTSGNPIWIDVSDKWESERQPVAQNETRTYSFSFKYEKLNDRNGFIDFNLNSWSYFTFRNISLTRGGIGVRNVATITQVNQVERTASSNSATITSIQANKADKSQLSNYATVTTVNQIKQTASSNSATITSIQASKADTAQVMLLSNLLSSTIVQLNNLDIGGRNLLLGTSQDEKTAVQQLDYRLATALPLGELTFSIWLKADKDTTVAVYINDDLGQNRTHLKFDMNVPVTTEFKKYTFTETLTKFQTADLNGIFMRVYSPGTTLTAKEAMLERGNLAADWGPAPEELVSQTEYTAFMRDYEATAKGTRELIAQHKLNRDNQLIRYNEIVNTVDKHTQTIGSDGGNLARKVMTDSLFETEIRGIKDSIGTVRSQIVQLDNEIALRIEQGVGGVNLVRKKDEFIFGRYRGTLVAEEEAVSVSEWGAVNAKRFTGGVAGDSEVKLYKDYRQLDKGEAATLSFWVKNNGIYPIVITTNGLLATNNQNMSETISPGDSRRVVFSGTTRTNYDSWQIQIWNPVRHPFDFILWREKLERGPVATDWSPSPEDSVDRSQLISELNLQAGRVLIRSGSNLLNVTPNTTYIQDATIKNQHVETLHGSKIIANSIHGNRIIANTIDARNVNGLTSSFVRSLWNNINRSVSIDASGLNVEALNNWSTNIGNDGLRFNDKYGNRVGGYIAMVDHITKEPISSGITAEIGYDAGILYQGTDRDNNLWNRAIMVGGQYGDIKISRSIRPDVANVDYGLSMNTTSVIQGEQRLIGVGYNNNIANNHISGAAILFGQNDIYFSFDGKSYSVKNLLRFANYNL